MCIYLFFYFFDSTRIIDFLGMDTPSSQIMENDNEEVGAMEPAIPPPPPSQVKQPRFDLDDKFGKFEIKNLPRC